MQLKLLNSNPPGCSKKKLAGNFFERSGCECKNTIMESYLSLMMKQNYTLKGRKVFQFSQGYQPDCLIRQANAFVLMQSHADAGTRNLKWSILRICLPSDHTKLGLAQFTQDAGSIFSQICLEILDVAFELCEHSHLQKGSALIFVIRPARCSACYVNEVQKHGLQPSIIRTNFQNCFLSPQC